MPINPSTKLEESGIIRETDSMEDHGRGRVRCRCRSVVQRVVSTGVGAVCRRGSVRTSRVSGVLTIVVERGRRLTIAVEQGGSESEKRVSGQRSGRERSEGGECGGVGCKPVGYVERTRVIASR